MSIQHSIRETRLPFSVRLRLAADALSGLFAKSLPPSTALQAVSDLLPRASPPRRGTVQFLSIVKENPLLRMAVHRIADGLVTSPYRVMAPTRRATVTEVQSIGMMADPGVRNSALGQLVREGEAREVVEHPAARIWNQNMGWLLPGLNLRKLTDIHYELAGEAFWLLGRNRVGVPVAALSIPPSWVVDTPTPSRPYFRFTQRLLSREVPMEDVVYFKDPDVADPYDRGRGAAQSLGAELEVAEYAAEHLRRFFHNDMRPPLIVYGPNFKKPERRRMETLWRQKLRGVAKAYLPFFMEAPESLTIKELSGGLRNNQMVELLEWDKAFIRSFFGIPPSVFGDFDDNSGLGRSGLEIEDYIFARWCLGPRLEAKRVVLQDWVQREFDPRLIVTYDNPVKEDKEYQLKVMTANPSVFQVGEWRGVAGFGPLSNQRADRAHLVASTLDVRGSLDPDDFSDVPPPDLPDPSEDDGAEG